MMQMQSMLCGCPSHLGSSSVGQSPQEHILSFPSDNILDRILPKNSRPSCISCWIIALLQSTEMINFCSFWQTVQKGTHIICCGACSPTLQTPLLGTILSIWIFVWLKIFSGLPGSLNWCRECVQHVGHTLLGTSPNTL